MERKNQKQSRVLFGVVLFAFALILLLGKLGVGGQLLKEELLSAFSTDLGGYELTLAKIVTAIAVLCCTYLICAALGFIIDALAKTSRAKTVRALVSSVLRWLGVIFGIVWALSVLGLNPTAVLASLGIVALILGFGAQSLIEDVISGLFIVFEDQYNVGDIIVLDDFRGTVERIGMRTTAIVDAGGNYKIINNSDIRNLQNRSRSTSLAAVEMGIDYGEDLLRVEAVCEKAFPEIYERHSNLFLSAPRYLGVSETGDSAVMLRYVVACSEENVYTAERTLRRELYLLFGKNNINIPFPQVVVHKGE